MKDFADWSKDFVEVDGTNALDEASLREIQVSPCHSSYFKLYANEDRGIEETSKETEISPRAGTAGGVTAASAIAALQRGRLETIKIWCKRDIRHIKNIIYTVIELVREFYTEARSFRITGANGQDGLFSTTTAATGTGSKRSKHRRRTGKKTDL